LLFAFANSQGKFRSNTENLFSNYRYFIDTKLLFAAIQCGGLFVSPSGLYFSDVVGDNTASAEQSFFITNAGLNDAAIAKFAIEGPAADKFTMSTQAPTTIARGSTVEVKISFTATGLGDAGALLNIETAETNASVVLKGLGMQYYKPRKSF
jgi:hypothetical protein